MTPAEHHLSSTWHLLALAEAVFEIIARPTELAKWWPSVFPEVLELDPGNETGAGRILRLEIKGWLPYVLNCHMRVLRIVPGLSLDFEVWGDVAGSGSVTATQRGEWTDLEFDAAVSIRKGAVRLLARLAWPLFSANHSWAGGQGKDGLIAALRKGLPEEGPEPMFSDSTADATTPAAFKAIIAGLAAALAAIFMLKRGRKRKSDEQ